VIEIYDGLRRKALGVFREQRILDETIAIRARTLSPVEAIGNPEGDDFPLQKGRERLMQAEFRGAVGQAFTDRFGDYEGTLAEILGMPLVNNYRRAVFVAALNAVLRHLRVVEGTVHCRDGGPEECSRILAAHIRERFNRVRITQVGFQPRMVQALAESFPLRVLDLDPDNIGKEKFGVLVEGPESTEEAVDQADLLLVTGTTLVNHTIGRFLGPKPVVFYGTTIAGASCLMGWDRFCAQSS
jgi:hypothetical protein